MTEYVKYYFSISVVSIDINWSADNPNTSKVEIAAASDSALVVPLMLLRETIALSHTNIPSSSKLTKLIEVENVVFVIFDSLFY